MSPNDEEREKRFQRTRDVLAVLVGILGTIVGFYFGAAEAGGAKGLTLSATAKATGQPDVWQIVGSAQGGMPAIHYRIVFSPQSSATGVPDKAAPDGWIVETVKLAEPKKSVKATIIVSDAAGITATQEIEITAPPNPETSSPPGPTPTPTPTPSPAGAAAASK